MLELEDGRWLMASYADIRGFFGSHSIVGRTILDIRPAAMDYMLRNLEDLEDIETGEGPCTINTDSRVCLIFTDGDHIEVEFSGDGPVILGFNTARFEQYPDYQEYCYKLSTVFQHCIGQTIMDIGFDNSYKRMMFPSYRGIDMSDEDEGIKAIRFLLEDSSMLIAGGAVDWFFLEHRNNNGEYMTVPLKDLVNELAAWPSKEYAEDDSDDDWDNVIINLKED